MRRIVYEVEAVKKEKKHEQDSTQVWVNEKRNLAMKLINNASVLSDAVNTFKHVLEKNPDADLKVAVAKIDSVIEDLKLDFNKNYFL